MEVRKTIRNSKFIIVIRTDDKRTCLLNFVDGERVIGEYFKEQQKTEGRLPCADLPRELKSVGVPSQYVSEVDAYLKHIEPDQPSAEKHRYKMSSRGADADAGAASEPTHSSADASGGAN
ncbi:MAG: hypothetical protein HYZ28_00185 [Myxococcales bacterium]|nr:hypothetical protein [Myxococcales bacterium]